MHPCQAHLSDNGTRKMYIALAEKSSAALQLRFAMLQIYNDIIGHILPLVDLKLATNSHSFATLITTARSLLFSRVKIAYLEQVIRVTSTEREPPTAQLDRLAGKLDTVKPAAKTSTIEKDDFVRSTVFGQLFAQLHTHPASHMRHAGRCFRVLFRGEDAQGDGTHRYIDT